jgi:two-component system OmpR family sensor kinase
MFRTLATRLVAAYVFGAIVLVVIVSCAVTAFALSMFGISARETAEEVARQAPEEVRLEEGKSGTLRSAAVGIARHLWRPGTRVAVLLMVNGQRRLLAGAGSDPGNGEITVFHPDGRFGSSPVGAPGTQAIPGMQGPPGGGPGGGPRHFWGGEPYPSFLNFFMRLDVKRVDVPGGRIEIIPDAGPFWRNIDAFWLASLLIGVFVVAAAWLLGRYITEQALRPLRETTASLNRFGDGDFTPRPVVATDRNEIGELARAYNAAAAQVSAAFDERRAAEFEMRQFIADAGHELRTPLTVIMGFIDVLRRRATSEPTTSTKIYDTMLVESRRMKRLIDKLILLARLENPHVATIETVDIGQVAGDVVSALQVLGSQPRVVLDVERDALVRGDEHELYDALSNLVENALKYAPDSPVEVHVRTGASAITIDVIDRGPGIPLEEQEQVFARFYRGRERNDAEGFGLGLAIARRAVERAGGELTLASTPGEGSRFTISIPRAERGESATLAV